MAGNSYLSLPVRLLGCEKPHQHITIKYLGTEEVSGEMIHEASEMPYGWWQGLPDRLRKMDLSGVEMKPVVWRSWAGVKRDEAGLKSPSQVYVLQLLPAPDVLSSAHSYVNYMRKDEYPVYNPHVTVDFKYWCRIREYVKNNKRVSAEALITQIGPVVLFSRGRKAYIWD